MNVLIFTRILGCMQSHENIDGHCSLFCQKLSTPKHMRIASAAPQHQGAKQGDDKSSHEKCGLSCVEVNGGIDGSDTMDRYFGTPEDKTIQIHL